MRKILLALAIFASIAHAATWTPTFTWTQSSTYNDKAQTPLLPTDIAGNTIYDGDTIIAKLTGNVSSSGPVVIPVIDCKVHVYTITTTLKNGIESDRSTPVSAFLCLPVAPKLIILGM